MQLQTILSRADANIQQQSLDIVPRVRTLVELGFAMQQVVRPSDEKAELLDELVREKTAAGIEVMQ